MDQSLDQLIKDRKIKFPGRGGGQRGSGRGGNRGNRSRGGRGFGRGMFQQRRGGFNFRGQRGFRGAMNFRGFGGRGRSPMMYQSPNFGGMRSRGFGFRGNVSNRGNFNFNRGFFNRNPAFGRGRPQNFLGVRGGGIMKRQQMPFSGGVNAGAPVKLYISNLDFGVSNQDIKELFSEFGRIRRYGVNFAQSGQSLGTAEVQYENRSSAVRAVQKYNNVPLDGRAMKLAISGPGTSVVTANDSFAPRPRGLPMRGMNQQQRIIGRGVSKKLVDRSKMTLMRGQGRGFARGFNRGFGMRRGNRGAMRGPRGSMRGRGGNRGGKNPQVPTQQQLDADLDAFNSKTD